MVLWKPLISVVGVNSCIQWLFSDDDHKLRDYVADQILCMARMHMTMDLDFVVLSFKIPHKNDYSSHAITVKPQYPRYNSIIVRIYQWTNIYNIGIDKIF